MTLRARVRDRRRQTRFDVVGVLPGSVTMLQTLALHNLSCGGALIESPIPLAPDALHTIQLESTECTVVVQVRVVRTSSTTGGRFTAIDFVDLDAVTLEQIQQLFSRRADRE